MLRRAAFIVWLVTCLFVQLGNSSVTEPRSVVGVSGLSSGVAMVALGGVRLFATAALLLLV